MQLLSDFHAVSVSHDLIQRGTAKRLGNVSRLSWLLQLVTASQFGVFPLVAVNAMDEEHARVAFLSDHENDHVRAR